MRPDFRIEIFRVGRVLTGRYVFQVFPGAEWHERCGTNPGFFARKPKTYAVPVNAVALFPSGSRQVSFAISCSLVVWALAAHATDWPQYRGAGHDGVSRDRIKTQWSTEPPAELWRVPCTNGLSSFAVSGGRAFTQIRRNDGSGDKEVCVALDALTGKELWSRALGPAAYDGGTGSDDGPRSTPSVQGGRVLVLTSYLVLHCLNATNGASIWNKDLLALYQGSNISWQNAASPLVDNDLIFVNCNTASESLLALRASDGSQAWRSQTAPLTHSTPVTATIQGVRQIVFAAQRKLVSLNRDTGALLWSAAYPFNFDTSLAGSPVVCSNIVFISANYTMGAFATRITLSGSSFVATPAWTNISLKAHWMTPVYYEGCLYGMFGSSATAPLKCIDAQTGTQRWSVNGFGRGGTILVDRYLLVLAEQGDLVLVEPNPAAYVEIARFHAFLNYNADNNKCWNVPAVCDGRIYARSTAEALCLDVAVPALTLLTPQVLLGNRLQLRIATDSGTPLDASRLAGIRVHWSTDLGVPLENWPQLTNSPTLVNGQATLDVPLADSPAFYMATESK